MNLTLLLPRLPQRSTLYRVAPAIAYCILAFWSTWPVLSSPFTTIPIGSVSSGTVPLFNLWTFWWNADRLAHGCTDYWHSPIFHPLTDTFAFSEPQPTSFVVAPLIWITGSRAFAYNVYLWLQLILNGVFTERLLKVLHCRPLIAVGGGCAMVLLPIAQWQMDVVQLLALWGFLGTWTALLKVGRLPSLRCGAEAGLFFGLLFLACVHHALFFAVVLAGTFWLLIRYWLSWKFWGSLAAGALVAFLVTAPVLLELRKVMKINAFERPKTTVAYLSALPGDYTGPTGRQLIDFGNAAARPFWSLGPGWCKTAFACLGVFLLLFRRRHRRWAIFLLTTIGLSFALSLGTNLQIGNWQPWWSLVEYVPGFSQVRNAFRFAFFVQMAVVLLGAQGLNELWVRCGTQNASMWKRRLIAGLLFAAGIVALIETRPEALKTVTVPQGNGQTPWIAFVRDKTPPGLAIACLPFAQGNSADAFEQTLNWMYFGTYHHVPLVNGYSGFFPQSDFDLRTALNTGFLNEDTAHRLAAAGARYLVVQRSAYPPERMANLPLTTFSAHLTLSDPSGIDVYRLRSKYEIRDPSDTDPW